MKHFSKIPIVLIALLINLALYLAVPFMQAVLHQKALRGEKKTKVVEHELVFEQTEPEKVVKREIKEIKLESVQPPNLTQGRPSSPGGGLKIDLSAAGGEGLSLVSGGDRSGPLGSGTGGGSGNGLGAMVYEQGQTDEDARLLGKVKLNYPPRAEREGVAGYADVLFLVNESGLTEQISVLKEEPEGYGFGTAAIDAARKERFRPAQVQKTPVKQNFRQRFSFGNE